MNSIMKNLKNKNGHIGIVYLIVIFGVISLSFIVGMFETSKSVMLINEVQDILNTSAEVAVRKGIDENSFKNEDIVHKYDKNKVKEEFKKAIIESINSSLMKVNLKTSILEIEEALDKNTVVTLGSEKWVNTWQDNGDLREIDFVVVSTVIPLKIKNSVITSEAKDIEKEFDRTLDTGAKEKFKVEVKEGKGYMGVFVKFETKIILK